MATRRLARLNDQIRADISELIRREMKDPRLAGLISVTGVQVSPDLRFAKVFVSVLGSVEDEKHSLTALRRASGFLRGQLAERLTTRRAPELQFYADTSIERGQRIMSLIREIEREAGPPAIDVTDRKDTPPSPSKGAPDGPR